MSSNFSDADSPCYIVDITSRMRPASSELKSLAAAKHNRSISEKQISLNNATTSLKNHPDHRDDERSESQECYTARCLISIRPHLSKQTVFTLASSFVNFFRSVAWSSDRQSWDPDLRAASTCDNCFRRAQPRCPCWTSLSMNANNPSKAKST